MTVSLLLSLVIVAAVFVTAVLSGVLGMAGGMVLMGVLVSVLTVPQAMVLHAVAQFFSNASRAFFHRAHIRRETLPAYFSGMAVVFIALVFLAFVPGRMMVFLLLGVGPFIAYALPKNMQLDFMRSRDAFLCGVTVTLFQLTGGVSGPLLDVFFQNRRLTRHETIATKAFTQSASHVSKFVYFGLLVSSGSATVTSLPWWLYAAVIPAAFAGTHASRFILEKIEDRHFYRVTQIVLFAIGAFYLGKAFLLWWMPG